MSLFLRLWRLARDAHAAARDPGRLLDASHARETRRDPLLRLVP